MKLELIRLTFKEPLTHFLLLASVVFILSSRVDDENIVNERNITIDRASIINLLQEKNRVYDKEYFEQYLDKLTKNEIDDLVEEYTRQEILYRTAISMNLDSTDYSLKQYLIKQLVQLIQGSMESSKVFTEKEIGDYYEKNRSTFYIEGKLSFTHIYFDASIGTKNDAERKAVDTLALFKSSDMKIESALQYGDRFLYQSYYSDKPKALVENHFGQSAAKELFDIQKNEEWTGPIMSDHGFHLVYVFDHKPHSYLDLETARPEIIRDLNLLSRRESTNLFIKKLTKGYDISVSDNIYQGRDHG